MKVLSAVRVLLLTICGAAIVQVANATPVTWTLSGATFDDGGTAVGSFVYDSDTPLFSAINIVTSGGTNPGATFTVLDIPFGSFPVELVALPTGSVGLGTPGLILIFSSPLSNAGGTISLTFESQQAACVSVDCVALAPVRQLTKGSVTSVPEPATFNMFAAVIFLAGMGVVTRQAYSGGTGRNGAATRFLRGA
jgi:hypothetical protein